MFNRYISRPTEVEAVYWDGSQDVMMSLVDKGCHYIGPFADTDKPLQILAGVNGEQGYVPVPLGNYILFSAEPSPHFWPCDKQMFERKYDQLIPGHVTIHDVTKRSFTGTVNPDGRPASKEPTDA